MAKLVHEPNLLHHYFDPTSAIYTIIEEMRQGCLHNECRRFEVGLVNRAKKEVQIKNESLDASTYPFAQDLYHHLHGNKKGRVVMAVEGTFYGNNDIKSAITRNDIKSFINGEIIIKKHLEKTGKNGYVSGQRR